MGRKKEFVEVITELKYMVDNDFVCMNDVTKTQIYGLNPVIYNRQLPPEYNKHHLWNHIYSRFRVDLSDQQLSYLCDNDLTSIEFIRRLKKML